MKNIKEKMQKIGKFIVSRMFYLILGICIAVAIPIAYAAWNTLVNPGETLTAAGWNEHVNKLIELNNRTTTLENGNIYRTAWQVTATTCTVRCGADFCIGREIASTEFHTCSNTWNAGNSRCVCLKL